MNKTLNEQKTFLIAFMLWIIAATVMMLAGDKIYWQQLINDNQFIATDYFFKYFTWLGDGLLITIICILLVFYRIRLSIFTLTTYLISGLFAQILKRFVFDDVYRPAHVFRQLGLEINQVLDVGLKGHHSFPSGHTTSAFALFFSLSLMLAAKNKTWQLIFFLAAFFVGLSRVYLNLHFVNDVVMGSILGLVTTLFLYLLFVKFKAPWLDKSLTKVIQNR